MQEAGGTVAILKIHLLYLATLDLGYGMPDLCCGSWAYPAASGILIPGPGIEPMFPTLQGGFLTTRPPKKSFSSVQFSSVQWLSRVRLFVTP